jgi:hypothetical protein
VSFCHTGILRKKKIMSSISLLHIPQFEPLRT